MFVPLLTAKAFDTVYRDALWCKLLLNNINGNMLNVIVNMYNGTKSCIMYKDSKSGYFPCSNGVRQRDNLLSFPFALYINDLECFLEGCYVEGLKSISDELESHLNLYIKPFAILYADDTILLSESAITTFKNNLILCRNIVIFGNLG